jgi:hypothetical protein
VTDELRVPDTYTVVPTDDPNVFVTLSSFADGDVSIGSIEMVELDVDPPMEQP